MRALAIFAILLLAGCDVAPKLSGNRADVPEAGSEAALTQPDAAPTDVTASPAAMPRPTPTMPVDETTGADDAAPPAATTTTTTSASPAFACRGATSQVETLICNDGRLARLDRRLTNAYTMARRGADATSRANLLEGQRQFLAQRDACDDARCVAQVYRDRIDDVERSAAMADDSCRAEIGEAAAARLVRQCLQASPATHPPCNAANSCAMIQGEIDRSCAMFGPDDDTPGFCRRR